MQHPTSRKATLGGTLVWTPLAGEAEDGHVSQMAAHSQPIRNECDSDAVGGISENVAAAA